MAKTIEDLFYFIHLSVDFILLFLFLILVKNKKKALPLFLISIYVFLDSLLNIFDAEFSRGLYQYVWSAFTLVEYSIFSYIILSTIRKPHIKKSIVYISVLFIVFSIIYNIATNFKRFDSIPIGVETILILLFSFYYLYEQMNDTTSLFIYSKYQFWIIIGFMIYLSGSFFIYIFASGLNRSDSILLSQYWMFTNGFYFLMIILFSISLFVYKKSKRNNSINFRPYLS
jgi:hypothetical protein